MATILQKQELTPTKKRQDSSHLYTTTDGLNIQSYENKQKVPHNPSTSQKTQNLKHVQENKKGMRDLTDNHSQLFFCAKLWMGLINTNLRTNKIFRLAKCILRFTVSQCENVFQGHFHENSENWDNPKAPNLLRHLPFCSRLYSSHITYLLWSSILFATFNCLHNMCQRSLYEAIPGVSPFIQILKTSNWNKSAFVHWLERNNVQLQWLKSCPLVSIRLPALSFSKKRRVKAECWQPNKIFEETVWFQL